MIYDHDLINLKSLVDFLGDTFGDSIEFTVHDLSKPGETIIAIKNGNVTGRKVGDSISDFAHKAIEKNIRNESDLRNLQANVNALRKDIKSNDMLILSSDGTVRGLISVNIYLKPFLEIQHTINEIIKQDSTNDITNGMKENWDSFQELAGTIVDNILDEIEIPADRMTPDERLNIIQKYERKGIFQLKGVTGMVAEKLGISEASVYRYLGMLRNSD